MAAEEGRADPLPWYLPYIRAAERLGIPPWECLDDWTPKHFWVQAVNLVAMAEHDAHEERETIRRAMSATPEAPPWP